MCLDSLHVNTWKEVDTGDALRACPFYPICPWAPSQRRLAMVTGTAETMTLCGLTSAAVLRVSQSDKGPGSGSHSGSFSIHLSSPLLFLKTHRRKSSQGRIHGPSRPIWLRRRLGERMQGNKARQIDPVTGYRSGGSLLLEVYIISCSLIHLNKHCYKLFQKNIYFHWIANM